MAPKKNKSKSKFSKKKIVVIASAFVVMVAMFAVYSFGTTFIAVGSPATYFIGDQIGNTASTLSNIVGTGAGINDVYLQFASSTGGTQYLLSTNGVLNIDFLLLTGHYFKVISFDANGPTVTLQDMKPLLKF